MSYIGDLLGLLNYQQNNDYGLGRIQLGREELGEKSRQFDTSANQWQQEQELQRQMEQFRQEQLRAQMARDQSQQNYTNFNRDMDSAQNFMSTRANRKDDMLKFLQAGGRGLIGSDQADALYQMFGLPGFESQTPRRL